MIVHEKGETSRHWRYRLAGDDGFATGRGDATVLLHTTRGIIVRVSGAGGGNGEEDVCAFLADVEGRARAEGMVAMCVSASPREDGALVRACRSLPFHELKETVMARWITPVGSPLFETYVGCPDGVTVRQMRTDEYPDVRARLLPLVSGGPFTSASYAASLDALNTWIGGYYRPFVVEENGRVVAYAENNSHDVALFAHGTVGHMRIERVVVAPEARGRRLSEALVAELVRDAARMNHTRVELQVRPDNVPAIRAYEKLGFRPTDGMLFWKSLT